MHEVCSLTVMYKVFMFCCAFVLLTRISLVVIPAALHQSSLSSLLPLVMMCVHVGWRFLWDGFFYCHVFTLAVWTPTMAFFCCIAPAGTAGFIILLFSLDRWIAHMLNNIITVVCIVCLLLCSLAVLRLNFVKYLYHWKRKAYY